MNRPLFLSSLAAAAVIAGCASSKSGSRTTDAAYAPATFAEQVRHGQTLFGEHCAKCHGDAGQGGDAPRLVGLDQGALPVEPPAGRKLRTMRFVTVGDVAEFVMANMPLKRPGSLTDDQYLAILAFDLKANGIDLGREPLTMAKAKQLTIPR